MIKKLAVITALLSLFAFAEEETETAKPAEPTNAPPVLPASKATNLIALDVGRYTWTDGTNILAEATISTNTETIWVDVEKIPLQNGRSVFKQVGFLFTNRVALVVSDGKTNEVKIKLLGRAQWPTEQQSIVK